jgi:hypothetical protein
MRNTLNNGLKSFGVDYMVKELSAFCESYPSLPVVSVGSGNGYLESLLPDKEWVLVDPAPLAFYTARDGTVHSKLYMKPSYRFTRDLINARPEIAGGGDRCLLLLNWPNHGQTHAYDLEAILLLKPRAVFIVHEISGSAGSKQLNDFVKNLPTSLAYEAKHSHEIIEPGHSIKCAHTALRITWLQRHDNLIQMKNCPLTIHTLPCQQSHDRHNKNNIMLNSLDRLALEKPDDILQNFYALGHNHAQLEETIKDPQKFSDLRLQVDLILEALTREQATKK